MIPRLVHRTRHIRRYFTHLSHITGLALLALSTVRLVSNLRFLQAMNRLKSPPTIHPPRVSVLIPARNEAGTIVSCVTSLLRQRYPNLEVLVLDDASTDDTGALLDTLQAEHPELSVIHTADNPPPDWNGKSYACYQLAQQATGEWLLFTDADTTHTPDSIERGIAQATSLNVRLLSALPHQRTKTWSERILVSFIMDFIPLLMADFKAIARGRSSRVMANGQYLLTHAATYRELGGHAAIAQALIDDFALAQRFHATGHGVALVDGTSMVECRMYRSVSEVWDGFSKNLLNALPSSATTWVRAGLTGLLLAPLFAWGYACLFVLPFFCLVIGRQRALPAVEVCWLFLLRGLVANQMRRPATEILTTPVAAWGVMAICTRAVYNRCRGLPIAWKGRRYFL